MANATSGASTIAETTRSASPPAKPALADGAIAAFAAVVLADCRFHIGLGEVRPQRVEEDQLGVCRLPQEEVAEALLAGGANDHVGIGQPGGRKLARERR